MFDPLVDYWEIEKQMDLRDIWGVDGQTEEILVVDIGDEREEDSISSAFRVSVLDDKADGNCLCS